MNRKTNNALKLITLCVIIFSSCKNSSFVSRKYMKGKFVDRIGELSHKKQSLAESNRALKAKPLIEEDVINKDSIRSENYSEEKSFVKSKKNKKLAVKKFEVVKDSTNKKEIKDEPPAKRKYQRVLKGFAWVAGGATIITILFVLLSIFTNIYLDGFIWYVAAIALGSIFYLSVGILFILVFIYAFLKQTKKFRGEADKKKGYTKVKWEYIFLLLVQLICSLIAAFGSIAIIPAIFLALISFFYYNKERKITKETDFFNYKRTRVFIVLVGIILMLSCVLAFGGLF